MILKIEKGELVIDYAITRGLLNENRTLDHQIKNNRIKYDMKQWTVSNLQQSLLISYLLKVTDLTRWYTQCFDNL